MKPFISPQLYLKEIPEISGWGVFTQVDIPAETVIEVSPVIVYPRRLMDIAIYMASAEGIPDKKIGIDQYGIIWPSEEDSYEKSAIMLGYLSMYNHSNNFNSTFYSDWKKRLVQVVTIKDIQKHQQITVSYGPTWFDSKKTYVSYVDF